MCTAAVSAAGNVRWTSNISCYKLPSREMEQQSSRRGSSPGAPLLLRSGLLLEMGHPSFVRGPAVPSRVISGAKEMTSGFLASPASGR